MEPALAGDHAEWEPRLAIELAIQLQAANVGMNWRGPRGVDDDLPAGEVEVV
jgi:cytochrome c5